MHVVLVTHHYPPEVGAPQRRWGALVPRFVDAGHRVTVLAPSPHHPDGVAGDLSPEERPGARAQGPFGERIVRLRFRPHGTDLPSRVRDQTVAAIDAVVQGLRDLRGADRPDVVVSTVPGIPSIGAGAVLKRALRVPHVVEMRDAWPDLVEPSGMLGGPGGPKRQARRMLTHAIHVHITARQKHAAAVVTTTHRFAEVLRDRGVRHVEVIRNGAYLDEIPHLGPRDGDGPLRVVYVGTVGRSQGLHTAIEAVDLLARRGVPVELRIVGSGAEVEHLRALAERSAGSVDVRGRVPRAEVIDHYAWADTLLVSLRAWTPLSWTVPSKLYEALATGRHVTGVVAGEAAGIIGETGAGHTVPPEDPVALAALWERLSADRARLEVGERGRAWAYGHCDYDRLAERYLALLEEVRRR